MWIIFYSGYSGLYCVSGKSGDFSRSGYSAECDDSSVSLDFREYCDSDNSDEFYDFPQYGEFGDPGELGELGEYDNSCDHGDSCNFGDFFLRLVNLFYGHTNILCNIPLQEINIVGLFLFVLLWS